MLWAGGENYSSQDHLSILQACDHALRNIYELSHKLAGFKIVSGEDQFCKATNIKDKKCFSLC